MRACARAHIGENHDSSVAALGLASPLSPLSPPSALPWWYHLGAEMAFVSETNDEFRRSKRNRPNLGDSGGVWAFGRAISYFAAARSIAHCQFHSLPTPRISRPACEIQTSGRSLMMRAHASEPTRRYYHIASWLQPAPDMCKICRNESSYHQKFASGAVLSTRDDG
jgi:hypothetical protein